MDVDLGAGLGDDLGVFDGIDELFAPNSTTSDFFEFCALEDAQQDTGSVVTAPPSPGSSNTSMSPFGQGGGDVFAPEDWNCGPHGHQTYQPHQIRDNARPVMQAGPTMRIHVRGKPRARKRHDEDEALEAEEPAHPFLKRRPSSAATEMEDVIATKSRDDPTPTPAGNSSERAHSFEVSASAGWRPVVSPRVAKVPEDTTGRRRVIPPSGVSVSRTAATHARAPAGGAIKVKSVMTRPRISVFMSTSSRRNGPTKVTTALARPLGVSPRSVGAVPGRSATVSSAVLPRTYGNAHEHKPVLSRAMSAQTPQSQRMNEVKMGLRARTQAEQLVVETNPPVVAMGSRHSTAISAHEEKFTVPTLHRASSVGALRIEGSGDVFSRSPVLSPTGSIIHSCELSEQLGGGAQRRNLVCKVFGTGSPFSRPSSGPGC